jgi:hypothetical protein
MKSKGELSLDMIVGLTIFMLSFIFIAQYIPSIFVVEREELSLYPLAYRTASLLAEDQGFWSNGSSNGTDWEGHLDAEIRIGLAKKPNILNVEKINALKDYYANVGYEAVRKSLGLSSPSRNFDYNISIQFFSSNSSQPKYALNGSEKLLAIGRQIPSWGEIAKYERMIAYDSISLIANISSKIGTPSTVEETFDVFTPVGAFVIVIQDRNTNETESEPWMRVWINEVKNETRIIYVRGEDTISTFDITSEVNSYTNPEVIIRAHNVRGYVLITNGGDFVGGRIGAKLVVVVW